MPEEQFHQLDQGDPEDNFQPPDLRPLRALAEREELADAHARLADQRRLDPAGADQCALRWLGHQLGERHRFNHRDQRHH